MVGRRTPVRVHGHDDEYVITPEWAVVLTGPERRVYKALAELALGDEVPMLQQLADDVGMGYTSVIRHIHSLQNYGLVRGLDAG